MKKSSEEILDTINFFRSVEEIDHSQLSIMMNLCKQKELDKGDILIQQGSKSNDIYFLMDGQLGAYVYDEVSKKNIQVGVIRRGEMIGDLSLALDKERLATVRVISESAVIVSLRIETFRNRNRYPEIKDATYFVFWRDVIQSLKWRIDMFEMKYSNSAKIVALADKARNIRRDVPSVHSFTFEPSFTLEIIADQASKMGSVLNMCNQLVAKHRALELD